MLELSSKLLFVAELQILIESAERVWGGLLFGSGGLVITPPVAGLAEGILQCLDLAPGCDLISGEDLKALASTTE